MNDSRHNEIDYQKYLSWTYFSDDAFDKEQFSRLQQFLLDETINLFIDVGASHGVYSYHANMALKNSMIIGIEADPIRYSILEKNFETWQKESAQGNKLFAINAAASDKEDASSKDIDFYVTNTQISGGLFAVQERSDEYKATSIPVVQLDDYYEPSANVFIKIDVEGAELRVLRGASKFIDSRRTFFLTEISWFGDRQRRTSTLDVLLFATKNRLRVERWGRSNYLLSPEDSLLIRLLAFVKSFPPLFIRFIWNRFVPKILRHIRERKLNKKRINRYTS